MSKKESKNFINLGVVVNDKDEVLMIRRVKKEPGKEGSVLEWAFSGGRQRLDESRNDCVKRHILSETGYDIDLIEQIVLRIEHAEFPIMVAYHLCKLKSEKPIAKPKEPHEIAEIKWIKKQDIKDLITTHLDEKVSQELGLE